jgi:hypothetical protein
MNEISRKKKIAGVAFGTAVLMLAGGAAFGYWSITGTGSDTATTGTVTSITVNQNSTVAGLAPGLAAQALSGDFDNPNSGPVYVAAVTAVVSGTDKVGCGPTDYTIAGTAPVGAQIASGSGVGSWSGLTIQFNNKVTNQDACKNAVVTIHYTAN